MNNHRDNCASPFTIELITIAKLWNQPECSIEDKWIQENVESFAAMKKNEIRPFTQKMDATRDHYIRRTQSDTEKQILCFFSVLDTTSHTDYR